MRIYSCILWCLLKENGIRMGGNREQVGIKLLGWLRGFGVRAIWRLEEVWVRKCLGKRFNKGF